MIDYGFGVTLGPLSDTPAPRIIEWRNRKEIYQWCRQYEPLEDRKHFDWYHSLSTRPDIKMYSVRANDASVGICGLTSIDLINRHAEFSLYIGPEHQRVGYGKAALQTLCAHGFNVIGLNHIFGESFDGNPAIKMFESIGFEKEGTRRGFYFREGKFIDAHLYSLMADKWK